MERGRPQARSPSVSSNCLAWTAVHWATSPTGGVQGALHRHPADPPDRLGSAGSRTQSGRLAELAGGHSPGVGAVERQGGVAVWHGPSGPSSTGRADMHGARPEVGPGAASRPVEVREFWAATRPAPPHARVAMCRRLRHGPGEWLPPASEPPVQRSGVVSPLIDARRSRDTGAGKAMVTERGQMTRSQLETSDAYRLFASARIRGAAMRRAQICRFGVWSRS